MSQHARDAIKCMDDNISNYLSPTADPVLYNVSLALKSIALAIEKLESQQYQLEMDIEALKRKIG